MNQIAARPELDLPPENWPHDLDVEEAVLGAAMARAEWADMFAGVSDRDFSLDAHQRAWRILTRQRGAGLPLSAVTVAAGYREVQASSGEADDGFAAALIELARAAPSSESAAQAAVQALLSISGRRFLMTLHQAGFNDAASGPMEDGTDDMIGRAIESLVDLREMFGAPSGATPATDLDAILEKAEDRGRDTSVRVMSDLYELDRMIGGYRPGEMHVVGGRPGMGKTIIGAGVALNAALAGHGVLFFSLEVNRQQLMTRLLCDLVQRSGHELWTRSLRDGGIPRHLMPPLIDARYRLEELPLIIDDRRGVTLAQITASAVGARRELRKRGGDLRLIVIDYLTLIQPSDRYKGNKVAEVTELSRGVKILAGEMGIPVIALAQLNRQTEGRHNADPRPRLSDIRESGSIEQDADSVSLLYREEYYVLQRKPAASYGEEFIAWQADYARARDRLEVIVAKNREGETGSIELQVLARCSAVRDMP